MFRSDIFAVGAVVKVGTMDGGSDMIEVGAADDVGAVVKVGTMEGGSDMTSSGTDDKEGA